MASSDSLDKLKVLALEGGRLPHVSFKAKGGKTLLIGTLTQRFRMLSIAYRFVEVDGLDATEKALEIASELSSFNLIMLSSVACAGFNILNPFKLHSELKVPVIIVLKEEVDNRSIYLALVKHFQDWMIRWNVFEELAKKAPLHQVNLDGRRPIYIEAISMDVKEAEEVVRALIKWGRVPEPLRMAEAIAKGITRSMLVKGCGSTIHRS